MNKALQVVEPPEGVQGSEAAPPPVSVEGTTELVKSSLTGIWADFVAHLPFIAGGFVVLLGTIGFAWIVKRVGTRLLQRTQLRNSLQELLLRLAVIAIACIGGLIAAMIVFPELTPTKALGAMGIASIAVGLAFQDIFENFFAGILLLWRFPFEEGDFIECEGERGKVEKVTVRNTLIRRTTGELLIVPNSFLFKNPVDVLTDRKKRRAHMEVGVAYDTDLDLAVSTIEKAVKSCSSVVDESKLQVYPKTFGGSSIDIEVAWWTSPEPGAVRKSRGELVNAIKKAFDEAGIEIPFPQRVLSFSGDDTTRAVVREVGTPVESWSE